MTENVSIIPVPAQQGILEKISSEVDVPFFVVEVNFHGKDKSEQKRLIRKIEDIIYGTEYKINGEFSDRSRENCVYHFYFRRIEPNA